MSWLGGWQYRKSHVIEGSPAGAVADYQVRIITHYGSGSDSGEHVYLNEHARADFGDVRFTGSDGETLLDDWIEELVEGDYAVFWVEVPSIPASPDTAMIYIYYGKGDATSISDGDATFEFFDDFSSDPNTSGKWEIYRHANDTANEFVYEPANKRVYLTKAVDRRGSFAFLKKNGVLLDCPEPGFAVKTRGGGGGGTGADGWALGFYKDPSPYQTYGRCSRGGKFGLAAYDGSSDVQSKCYAVEFDNSMNLFDATDNHNALVDTLTTITPETHHTRYDTNIANEDNITHDIEIYVYDFAKLVVDGVEHFSHSISFDKTYTKMGFGGATGAANNNHWIQDYVMVRKYVDPEPSHGVWGAEETIAPPPPPEEVTPLYYITYNVFEQIANMIYAVVALVMVFTILLAIRHKT